MVVVIFPYNNIFPCRFFGKIIENYQQIPEMVECSKSGKNVRSGSQNQDYGIGVGSSVLWCSEMSVYRSRKCIL